MTHLWDLEQLVVAPAGSVLVVGMRQKDLWAEPWDSVPVAPSFPSPSSSFTLSGSDRRSSET